MRSSVPAVFPFLSPEKHPIANALYLQLDTQGRRRRPQPSPDSSWRFAFAGCQAACFPSGDLLDVALVLLEPGDGRINCRPSAAGLFSRHSTESWHESPLDDRCERGSLVGGECSQEVTRRQDDAHLTPSQAPQAHLVELVSAMWPRSVRNPSVSGHACTSESHKRERSSACVCVSERVRAQQMCKWFHPTLVREPAHAPVGTRTCSLADERADEATLPRSKRTPHAPPIASIGRRFPRSKHPEDRVTVVGGTCIPRGGAGGWRASDSFTSSENPTRP